MPFIKSDSRGLASDKRSYEIVPYASNPQTEVWFIKSLRNVTQIYYNQGNTLYWNQTLTCLLTTSLWLRYSAIYDNIFCEFWVNIRQKILRLWKTKVLSVHKSTSVLSKKYFGRKAFRNNALTRYFIRRVHSWLSFATKNKQCVLSLSLRHLQTQAESIAVLY
jgi:hypothetical protein